MKLRKIICALLSSVMLLSIATACDDSSNSGGNNPSGTTAGTNSDGAAVTTVATTIEAASGEVLDLLLEDAGLVYSEETGTYRFTETRTISVELFDRGLDDGKTDPLTCHWTEWIQEGMLRDHNVKVEYVTVPRWTEEVEINNILAAGTAPDIMVTYNYPAIQTYAEMGGMLDMAPYVDDYKTILPDLWDLLGPTNMYYDKDPITGTIWAIEAILFTQARIATFVREDWLNKLDMSAPTTIEEFETMLYAFKDNAELLLGAEADKMIPFTLSYDVGWRADHLLAAFIPSTITDKEMYTLGFDDRHFLFPGHKEGIRKLNEWYNNGLIWSEFALYGPGDTTETNLMKSGYVGSMIHNWDLPYRGGENGVQGTMQKTVGEEAVYVAVDCFKNDAGTYTKFLEASVDRKVCFTSTNDEPVASVLYLNWISRQDVRSYLASGEEGINHEVLDDGTAQQLDPLKIAGKEDMIMNSPFNIDYTITFNSNQVLYYKDDETSMRGMAQGMAGIEPRLVELAFKYSINDGRVAKNVSVGKIESEEGMSTALKNKRDAVYAKAITVSIDNFDAEYDSGYQDYLTSGGQAIIDERTSKWVEFFGDATNLS